MKKPSQSSRPNLLFAKGTRLNPDTVFIKVIKKKNISLHNLKRPQKCQGRLHTRAIACCESISCPLPHARTGKEARSLGSGAGKERSKKRAREKRSVTQPKREEYSLKKQENKI